MNITINGQPASLDNMSDIDSKLDSSFSQAMTSFSDKSSLQHKVLLKTNKSLKALFRFIDIFND